MLDDFKYFEGYTPQLGELKIKGTAKILNIFFIVDVSGSMRIDGRMDALNESFVRMVPALRQIQIDCMSEFELRIAIMTFHQKAQWIVEPTPIMEYNHKEISCTEWVTFYSNALKKLNEKLTRKEFMEHSGKMAQPYIMFMTDGEPYENDNYQVELDKLNKNGWFKAAQRYAVLIGKEAINSEKSREAVKNFVSNPIEGIINALDAEEIISVVQARTLHTIKIETQHHIDLSVQGADSNLQKKPKPVDDVVGDGLYYSFNDDDGLLVYDDNSGNLEFY